MPTLVTQNLVPTVAVLSVAVRLVSAKIVIHMTIVAVTIHVQAMKKNVVQVEQHVNQMVQTEKFPTCITDLYTGLT